MEDKTIQYIDFKKVDIRLGTIIEAEEYNQLKKPSIILKLILVKNWYKKVQLN